VPALVAGLRDGTRLLEYPDPRGSHRIHAAAVAGAGGGLRRAGIPAGLRRRLFRPHAGAAALAAGGIPRHRYRLCGGRVAYHLPLAARHPAEHRHHRNPALTEHPVVFAARDPVLCATTVKRGFAMRAFIRSALAVSCMGLLGLPTLALSAAPS